MDEIEIIPEESKEEEIELPLKVEIVTKEKVIEPSGDEDEEYIDLGITDEEIKDLGNT